MTQGAAMVMIDQATYERTIAELERLRRANAELNVIVASIRRVKAEVVTRCNAEAQYLFHPGMAAPPLEPRP